MKSIKTSLKNNKKYFKLLLILLFLGFFIGLILIKKLNIETLLENTKSIESYLNTNKINFLTNHLLTLLILCISAITLIGLILFPLNIIYEGICIFFNIYTLTNIFKLNGFVYSIIYITITKGLYLSLFIIIFKKLITMVKIVIAKKDKNEKKALVFKNLKQISIYTFLLISNDFLIFLIGNKILSIFLFIIK